MLTSNRLVRAVGLVAILVAVGGALAGCGSKSLVENFNDKIQASDFQASGPITGSLSMTVGEVTWKATFSGTLKIKGNDNAATTTIDAAAVGSIPASSTTAESITVGDWNYTRDEGEAWTKEAKSRSDDIVATLRNATVTDKGVESHNGQQLHRLESTQALDPNAFIGDMSGVSDAKLTLTLWARDDGTPAGMTVAGTYKQTQGEYVADMSLSMDFAFTSFSGVTIEAPSM